MTAGAKTRADMIMEVQDALNQATVRLARAGVDTPRLDAELLMTHALGRTREDLFLVPARALESGESEAFEALMQRRAAREPMARILGAREFWSLDFTLNAATLVPRPDSETLVQAALDEMASRENAAPRILDLGTGSGCLLLALLSELPAATGVGLDCDQAAVVAARQNAHNLGLVARVEFRGSDWFEALGEDGGRFDAIISNPPYIRSDAIAGLPPEVAKFEPPAALDGGADGLQAYRAIVAGAAGFLAVDGVLLLELGLGQEKAVAEILGEGGFAIGEIYPDLAGIPRVIGAVLAP